MYLNPHGNYQESHIKHLQVVYLAKCEKLVLEKIATITGYAISTIKAYIRKFAHLLEKAKEIFVLNAKDVITALCDLGKPNCEKVYLFKFYDEKKLLFSKIGLTKRTILQRLKEELKSYIKNGFDIHKAVICSVYECNLPAEGAEGHAKGYFIKKYPKEFQKNDRFMQVDISISEFNKIIEEYLGGEPP